MEGGDKIKWELSIYALYWDTCETEKLMNSKRNLEENLIYLYDQLWHVV